MNSSVNPTLRFPRDATSAGGFFTRLEFESWTNKPSVNASKKYERHGESTVPDHVQDIWLPMPNEIATGYSGQFEDANDMHLSENRAGGIGGTASGRLEGIAKGLSHEIVGLLNAVTAPNASSKMSSKSVLNNNMGVSYGGSNLRSHTFSWNLMPKNSDEQAEILSIVRALKMNSTSKREGLVMDEETRSELLGQVGKESGSKVGEDGKSIITLTAQNAAGAIDHITTLTIPMTVKVSFYQQNSTGGYEINYNLFKVNSSFVTAFDVSYSGGGGWSARPDGSPTETVITMTLKEIQPITQSEIIMGA